MVFRSMFPPVTLTQVEAVHFSHSFSAVQALDLVSFTSSESMPAAYVKQDERMTSPLRLTNTVTILASTVYVTGL
jgi:hypothetical protein